MNGDRDTEQHDRMPYASPKLVRYGTIAELTQGGYALVGDGFAGDPGNGTVNPPGLGG